MPLQKWVYSFSTHMNGQAVGCWTMHHLLLSVFLVVESTLEMCHAFQEYAQYREDALESNYNVGRAAHHLGLVHIAAQYYHKCLNSTSSLPSLPANEEGQGLPLHAATLMREAAFNLSLIYRGAGADDLARQVLRQHVTI